MYVYTHTHVYTHTYIYTHIYKYICVLHALNFRPKHRHVYIHT